MTQELLPRQEPTASKEEECQKDEMTLKVFVPKAPYFFYRNLSDLPDPDPLKPLTSPGRIPNFPAKMMAILSRADLADIISWMPHGRSWKVHKPREFEVKVVPAYFEHSKLSSFVRQANGWAFRRMVGKGPDRNSYYHEMFLRGQPHLVKLMKRPTTMSRAQPNPDIEPNFYRISEEHPLHEIKLKSEFTHDEQTLENCSKSDDKTSDVLDDQDPITIMPFPPQQQTDYSPITVSDSPMNQWRPVPSNEVYSSLYYPYVEPAPAPISPYRQLFVFPKPSVPHGMLFARAVPRVHSHIEDSQRQSADSPSLPFFGSGNVWAEACSEPREMPLDFVDPFEDVLKPIDIW